MQCVGELRKARVSLEKRPLYPRERYEKRLQGKGAQYRRLSMETKEITYNTSRPPLPL